MNNPIHVERSAVAAIVAATFPNYTGKAFKIQAAENVQFHDLNWSGGTRSQYVACTLDGQKLGDLFKHNATAPWNNHAEGSSAAIAPNACIVQHSIFCGKDMGLTIYVRPENLAPFLPRYADELTKEQRTVLRAIRGLIPRARRDECARSGISSAQYDAIVSELKAAGYLTPNGGLTLKGKNTAQSS